MYKMTFGSEGAFRSMFMMYPSRNAFVPCPGCGKEIKFIDQGEIEVRAESTAKIPVPGLMVISEKCNNPFCKWNDVVEEVFDYDGYL